MTTFIIEGQVTATLHPGPPELVHGQPEPRESLAYFCETCGEVWARVVEGGRPFRVISMSCSRHPRPYPSAVGGSLWLIWDRAFNDSLPPAVMRRELDLHLKHYDKWRSYYDQQD